MLSPAYFPKNTVHMRDLCVVTTQCSALSSAGTLKSPLGDEEDETRTSPKTRITRKFFKESESAKEGIGAVYSIGKTLGQYVTYFM